MVSVDVPQAVRPVEKPGTVEAQALKVLDGKVAEILRDLDTWQRHGTPAAYFSIDAREKALHEAIRCMSRADELRQRLHAEQARQWARLRSVFVGSILLCLAIIAAQGLFA